MTNNIETLVIRTHKDYADMSPRELMTSCAMHLKATETINKWAGSLAAGLHAMAYDCQRQYGVIAGSKCSDVELAERKELALALFEAKCEEQENWVKSEKAGDLQCTAVPRAWTQAKSKLTVAMKSGGDLSELTSCSACEKFNKETLAAAEQAEKDERAAKLRESGAGPEGVAGGSDLESDDSLSGVDPKLAESIRGLLAACAGTKDVQTCVDMVDALTVRVSSHVAGAFKKAAGA